MPCGWSTYPRGPGRYGPVGAQQVRVDQAVAVVATGRSEHRAHVLRRERRVLEDQALEARRELRDPVDHPPPYLRLEPGVLRGVLLDREPQRERRCRGLARRGQVRVGGGRDLERDNGGRRHDAAAAVLELALELLGRREEPDRALHLRDVEELERRRELRDRVERARQGVQGQVRRDRGHDPGHVDPFAVAQHHTADATVDDGDLRDRAVEPELAARLGVLIGQVLGEHADAALKLLGEHGVLVGHRHAERQPRRTPRRGRAAVRRVHGQEGQHAAQRRMLLLVGEVAVQPIISAMPITTSRPCACSMCSAARTRSV